MSTTTRRRAREAAPSPGAAGGPLWLTAPEKIAAPGRPRTSTATPPLTRNWGSSDRPRDNTSVLRDFFLGVAGDGSPERCTADHRVGVPNSGPSLLAPIHRSAWLKRFANRVVPCED